jgi:hypothetical protein
VVLLGRNPCFTPRDMRGRIYIALETRSGPNSQVIFSQPTVENLLNSASNSKLLAVDYIGTFLTLGGCTLFILPLIWVCSFHFDGRPRPDIFPGRCDFSMAVSYGPRPIVGRVCRGCYFVPVGVERSTAAHRPECVIFSGYQKTKMTNSFEQ